MFFPGYKFFPSWFFPSWSIFRAICFFFVIIHFSLPGYMFVPFWLCMFFSFWLYTFSSWLHIFFFLVYSFFLAIHFPCPAEDVTGPHSSMISVTVSAKCCVRRCCCWTCYYVCLINSTISVSVACLLLLFFFVPLLQRENLPFPIPIFLLHCSNLISLTCSGWYIMCKTAFVSFLKCYFVFPCLSANVLHACPSSLDSWYLDLYLGYNWKIPMTQAALVNKMVPCE